MAALTVLFMLPVQFKMSAATRQPIDIVPVRASSQGRARIPGQRVQS